MAKLFLRGDRTNVICVGVCQCCLVTNCLLPRTARINQTGIRVFSVDISDVVGKFRRMAGVVWPCVAWRILYLPQAK